MNRILLTRMKYIGDVILSIPAIRAVRAAYPNAYIAYLTDAKAAELLYGNPDLDEVISFDFAKDSVWYSLATMWKLRRQHFDLVFDFFSNPRSSLLTFSTGASRRIGLDVGARGFLFTETVHRSDANKNAITFYGDMLAPLQISLTDHSTRIYLSDGERKEGKSLLEKEGVPSGKKIIAIHPGATWPNKMWQKENFKLLIDHIIRNMDASVVLSPGPKDNDLITYLRSNNSNRIFALPLLPLRTLAKVLSACAVFVSNDCGPMHIGVAVGVKTIGIFGPEPPSLWFPYSAADGHIPFFKKIECSPCRTTSCHRTFDGYLECMSLITVDEIFDAVKERL